MYVTTDVDASSGNITNCDLLLETLSTDGLTETELTKSYSNVPALDFIIKEDGVTLTSGTANTFSLDSLSGRVIRLFFDNVSALNNIIQVFVSKMEFTMDGKN